MLAENRLHPSDFIWPLFVCDGRDCEEPIGSLPGVSRWSVDRIGAKAREAADLGIPCIALFPNTPNELRTDDAREALNANNLICQSIKAIKDAVPEIGVLTDVALDPYTSHGHDGMIDEAGNVINDDTVEILVRQADHHSRLDVRVLHERRFDFRRIDVSPAGQDHVCAAVGESAAATTSFTEALRLLEELHLSVELAETRIALARALVQLGDMAGARTAFQLARSACAHMGLRMLVDQIDSDLTRIDEGAGPAGPLVHA